eukprot:5376825-Prymnesium_polylepis.1
MPAAATAVTSAAARSAAVTAGASRLASSAVPSTATQCPAAVAQPSASAAGAAVATVTADRPRASVGRHVQPWVRSSTRRDDVTARRRLVRPAIADHGEPEQHV